MALPNNSLKLTRRAGAWGRAPGPPACATIRESLPASAGQLSSRPLGHAQAIEPLIVALNDEDPKVKMEVSSALRILGWKPAEWPAVDRVNPVKQIKWVQDELKWLIYDSRHDTAIQWWKEMTEAIPDLPIVYPGRDFSPENAKARAWSGLAMIIYYLRNPDDSGFVNPCPEAAFCWEQALALMPGDQYYMGCLRSVS